MAWVVWEAWEAWASEPPELPGGGLAARVGSGGPGPLARAAAAATFGTLSFMDRPPPDPAKLLEAWMQWERGEALPGRVMSNLKTGGLRDILEQLVEQLPDVAEAETPAPDPAAAESWTPVV